MSNRNKSIILLSGGLDSVVCLACAKEEYNIELALTFDYGQRACDKEIEAALKVANHYGIAHKVIQLPWLADITQTSLVDREQTLPELKNTELDDLAVAEKSAEMVWVPNRNGVFINIAAGFADSFGYTHIIFGANSEEGTTFPDNTQEFIDRVTASLEYSTLAKPKVFSPLIELEKKDIIRLAVEKGVPLEFVRSCYADGDKHCENCESCLRFKRALIEAGYSDKCAEIFMVC